MKLDQLRDIVAIVEHGSLRAAARRLDVPQPALTRSLRALEKELGVPLFKRDTHGMTLTPVGQLFHQRASAIVHEVRRARDEIAQVGGDSEGTVVACLSILPHVGLLPQALPLFRQRFPGVRLHLEEGLFPDIENQLRSGTADFYLGAAPRLPPAPGLMVQELFKNTRAVVARKGHPLSGARSLKGLEGAEWATTSIDYNADDDLNQLFKQHGLPPPRVMLRARTALSMMVGLMHTDLLGMVPVQWGEFPITRDSLSIVNIRERLPAPSIVLITRPGLPLTPAAEHLCDLMQRFAPKSAR
ncbi:LysR family transcriptional regulator [Variovorax saccharolyticus]|uniref:LysR family transcriptional regulator n=1 Tax=Variovorax saccharolyticus TaxID=3053516 RepID=UPI002574C2B7|nr:LysR substrate-binding domain-containing protein [Variovorax sp. J31P216]MDM0028362.1 LysR substrate-binding domain-containing protein [Variovorax sp. J31P216]